MEEAVLCGIMVVLVMLGVPLLHSIGECRRGRMVHVHLWRWWLLCALILLLSFILALLIGFSAFILSNLPPTKLSPLSTSCKIISKGVDLRTAKICELEHSTVSPTRHSQTGRSKFRCSFDYYWTSVYEVEFRPRASEAAVQAAAEAPWEALPLDCRPSFSTVWRAKEKFQINGDYPCKYSPSNLQRVELAETFVGNCTVQESLKSDILLHFQLLLAHQSMLFSVSSKSGRVFWRTVISISLGFCYSIFVTGVSKTACHIRFRVLDQENITAMDILYFEARLQGMLLFLALSITLGWLSSDYEDQFDNAAQLLIRAVQRLLQ